MRRFPASQWPCGPRLRWLDRIHSSRHCAEELAEVFGSGGLCAHLAAELSAQLPAEIRELIGLLVGCFMDQLHVFQARQQGNIVLSHRPILRIEEFFSARYDGA